MKASGPKILTGLVVLVDPSGSGLSNNTLRKPGPPVQHFAGICAKNKITAPLLGLALDRANPSSPMTKTYQIPCECGNVVSVTANQSGTNVTCACGRELPVPSLRELIQTYGPVEETARDEAVTSPLTGWIRLVQWLSGLLVFVAVIGFVALYIYRPQLPNLRKLPPAVAYHYFKSLQTGEPSPLIGMEARYVQYHGIWVGLRDVVLVVGIIGVLLFLGVTLAGWWELRSRQAEEDEIPEEPSEAELSHPD